MERYASRSGETREADVQAIGQQDAAADDREPRRYEWERQVIAGHQRRWYQENQVVVEAAEGECEEQRDAMAEELTKRAVTVEEEEIVRTGIPVSPE